MSKGLVSRVLRDDQSLRISESRRQQVLAVAARMGGVERSPSGRAVGHRLARNIVVPVNRAAVMQELLAHWENQGFMGLKSFLADHGFRLSIDLYESESPTALQEEYESLRGTCDGLVLLGGIVTEDVARFVLESQIPHVSIDPIGRVLGVNTVLEDSIAGFYQAIGHLNKLGHRRIGYLGRTQMGYYPSFMAAMAHHGLDFDAAWRCRSPMASEPIPEKDTGWREAARLAFGKWLDGSPPTITALCCHNDYGALGACDAMMERGLVPGQDISVVGFGDLQKRDHVEGEPLTLTTVRSSLSDLGRAMGEQLINQILHRKTKIVHHLIPAELVVRETTGPVKDPR